MEERRRAELRCAALASWGEEVADTLMELVTPAGHELATRSDVQGVLAALEGVDERWSGRLDEMDGLWSERLSAMDERLVQRSEAMEQRLTATFERGLREAITSQTRALVVSLLVSLLVSVVAIAGLAFGLAG